MEELEKINRRLVNVLSPESGYFGRVYTWGQRPTEYEPIGYVLSEDFVTTLTTITETDRKNLMMTISYFELHARPLKKIFVTSKDDELDVLYSEIAWSHFAILIMFGMLEFAIKKERGIWLTSKGKRMREFLEKNLSDEIKRGVARRYKANDMPGHAFSKFGDVVDHLWENIRGGFVHDMGVHSKGLEWHTLKGAGTKENPITIESDVPVQEWLQLTWQAILNSYGYTGKLELPSYNNGKKLIFNRHA